jgi:hypothetical protein
MIQNTGGESNIGQEHLLNHQSIKHQLRLRIFLCVCVPRRYQKYAEIKEKCLVNIEKIPNLCVRI